MAEIDAHTQTSVTSEDGSRTLTGVGVSAESLEAVVDRHEPDEAPASHTTPTGAAATPAQASPTTATNEPPQLAKGRARYSELTKQRDTEKARAEAAEKKAADLEARLSQPPAPIPAGTAPSATPSAERGTPTQAAAPQYTRPEPSEDDIGTTYQTYAAFTKDQALWVWEQQQAQLDQRIRQGIDADRAQSRFNETVQQTLTKGRELYGDFDVQRSQGPGAQVMMNQDRIDAIVQHSAAAHLLYLIAKDAAIAQRLATCPPLMFGAELEKLVPAPEPMRGNGRQPPPPAPMQPVGSGSRTTTTPSAEHAKAGNYAAYKLARAAERRGR